MQTVLVILSGVPGAVWLNGRLAGEVDIGRPLSLPVAATGPLLIEHHSLTPGYLPLAVRVPLSRGAPLPAALRGETRLCAALWPGGAVELELLPERVPAFAPPVPLGQSGQARLWWTEDGFVRCETPSGGWTQALPEGASRPALAAFPGGALLSGALPGGGCYALLLSGEEAARPLLLTGRGLTPLEDGESLRLLRPMEDTVGHASLETWRCTAQGWQLAASEPVWTNGAPAWPETPEATALAAIEAAQLGLMGEAASYFSPACACVDALNRAAAFDGCVPLRYCLPGGESAVGVTSLEEGLLRVVPARYAASRGGPRGLWQLDALRVGP